MRIALTNKTHYRDLYAWADRLPLEVKAAPVTIRPLADDKLNHCERMLKVAMTRERRAVTIRKKWQTKVKYYQRQIAAKGVQR